MTIRKIILYPDDVLRQPTEEVEEVDDTIRELVDDMVETMYDAPGIGLAAPQVGVSKRITVIDCTPRGEEAEAEGIEPELFVLINPQILERKGRSSYEEGCLSIPGVYEKVTRPSQVRVRALDRDGNPYEITADGLLATCLQHEIDHLDGVLFIDHLSGLKRRRLLKKYRKHMASLEEDEAEEEQDT